MYAISKDTTILVKVNPIIVFRSPTYYITPLEVQPLSTRPLVIIILPQKIDEKQVFFFCVTRKIRTRSNRKEKFCGLRRNRYPGSRPGTAKQHFTGKNRKGLSAGGG